LVSPIAEIELLAISIALKNQHISVIVVYVPPSLSVEKYNQLFEYIENSLNFEHPVLLVGDFNIPELSQCLTDRQPIHLVNIYKHFCALCDFTQYNNVMNFNNRILDVVLSTPNIDVGVARQDDPLIAEDMHHPALEINVSCSYEKTQNFLNNPESKKFNFH